jgi:toxin ParE1/3/4
MIVWSSEAIDDLAAIRFFVSHDNPQAAAKLIGSIVQLVQDQLTLFPDSGRPGRVAGTRELIISGTPYIVPYRVKNDRVDILRVYHAARRWPDRF